MVDYNTPLMLRPTVAAESLPNIYQQVETVRALQGANTDNDIKRDALNDYAARRSVGDPNAPDSLDTQPQLLAQVTAARNAMSQEQRTKFDFDMGHRARIAFAVSAYPAGSVERQKAWDSGLKELLQVGALPSEKYQEMVGKPPNDLVLQQYQMLGGLDFIKQARQDAAGARNMANFAAAEGGASPSTPGAPPPAAAAPAAAAPSPAAAAGFRPGPIPTPFGAPAAQPQPNAGLTPAAPVASPLRPAPASAPAPAPVAPAAAPAAPAYPAAAAAAAQGGAAVTPPAEAPAAPAGRTPEQAAEAEAAKNDADIKANTKRVPLGDGRSIEVIEMTPEQAAQEILKGWRNGRFEIHFPQRFTLWMKTLQLLPIRLYFAIIRRFTGL